MKTLYEVLVKQNVKPNEINFENFKKEIESILSGYGKTYEEFYGIPYDTEVYITKRELKPSPYKGINSNYLEYNIVFNPDPVKYQDNKIILELLIWDDKDLGRPRYRFEEFELKMPATSKGGYRMMYGKMNKSLPCKKLTEEFYEIALDSIRDIIERMMKNKKIMQDVYMKCRKSNKNPQQRDFEGIATKIYGDIWK